MKLGTGEILLIVAVLVLLFGARRLPDLARSIRRTGRELRAGLEEDEDDVVGEGPATDDHRSD